MKLKTTRKIVLILLVCLLNFWIWRVLSESILLGAALVLLSVFLAFKLKLFSIITFIALSIFLLKSTLDTNLLYISPLENDRLSNRHEYYAEGLGKIYRNRIGVYLHYKLTPYLFKFQRNLFYNLDPNLYFFSTHPRERLGIDEFSKFSPLALPVFLIGLSMFLRGENRFLTFYLLSAVFVSGFIFPGYKLGPILIFPFMIAVTYLGFLRVIKKILMNL